MRTKLLLAALCGLSFVPNLDAVLDSLGSLKKYHHTLFAAGVRDKPSTRALAAEYVIPKRFIATSKQESDSIRHELGAINRLIRKLQQKGKTRGLREVFKRIKTVHPTPLHINIVPAPHAAQPVAAAHPPVAAAAARRRPAVAPRPRPRPTAAQPQAAARPQNQPHAGNAPMTFDQELANRLAQTGGGLQHRTGDHPTQGPVVQQPATLHDNLMAGIQAAGGRTPGRRGRVAHHNRPAPRPSHDASQAQAQPHVAANIPPPPGPAPTPPQLLGGNHGRPPQAQQLPVVQAQTNRPHRPSAAELIAGRNELRNRPA